MKSDMKPEDTLKLVAFLLGGVVTAVLTSLILIILSIFVEIDLLTAFALQFLAAAIGGLCVVVRLS